MTKLKGSQKQVAWAEEIRAGYTRVAETLKEIVAVYSDTAQEEIIDRDPVFGDATRTVYTTSITSGQQAAMVSAGYWKPTQGAGKEFSWITDRSKEIGGNHADRLAIRDFAQITLDTLERALAEEVDARYWIDRR